MSTFNLKATKEICEQLALSRGHPDTATGYVWAVRARDEFDQHARSALPAAVARIERLQSLLAAASHLLKAATGPEGGPTDWNETRDQWFAEAELNQ